MAGTNAENTRWYILLLFVLTSSFQQNTWLTFSTVPQQVEEYFSLPSSPSGEVDATVGLLLNWGPIFFVITTPFSIYLLSYPITGLKHTVRLAALLIFLANLIRSIPTLLSLHFLPFLKNYEISSNFWSCLVFLHVGQILNAIAGPLVMGPPSKLSVIWFDESQRSTATGIAAGANIFGNCFGYLLGPFLVKTASDMPKLLIFDLVVSLIPCVLCFIYFPNGPKTPPTLASRRALLSSSHLKLEIEPRKSPHAMQANARASPTVAIDENGVLVQSKNPQDSKQSQTPLIVNNNDEMLNNHDTSFVSHLKQFLYEMKQLFRSLSAILVILGGGMVYGIFAGWSSVLQDMLSPLGLNKSDIGIIGFVFSLMTMIGTTVIGPVADKCFQRRLKRLMIYVFVLLLVALVAALVTIPSPFSKTKSLVLDSSYETSLVVIMCISGTLGLLTGALVPLFLELAAEVSFPVSEGTSNLLNVFVCNAGVMAMISVGTWMNTCWITLLVMIITAICMALLLFAKESYKRSDDA